LTVQTVFVTNMYILVHFYYMMLC